MSTKAEITWIPVSERLPQAYRELLVYRFAPDQKTFNEMGPPVTVAYYHAVTESWYGMEIVGIVTHWAELPEPPTERTTRS